MSLINSYKKDCHSDKTNYKVILSLAVISVLSINMLFKPGIIFCFDTTFHIARLSNLASSMRHGVFPLYVYPDMLNHFGYGISMFYSDFMLIIPAIFVALGAPVITVYKLLLIATNIMVVISSYFMAITVIKDEDTSIFCTALISLSIYLRTDVFHRGALGETFAFIFVPIVVAGIYKVVCENEGWAILAVGFSGLVMSHILSFVIMCIIFFAILVMSLFVYRMKKEDLVQKIVLIMKAVISSLLFTAWFVFPFLEQMMTTEFLSSYFIKSYNPINNVLRFRHLFIHREWKSLQSLGIVIAIVFAISALAFLTKSQSNLEKFFKITFIVGRVCIVGVTSLFPWVPLDPYLNAIQFPWRLNVFSTILFSLSGSYYISKYTKRFGKSTFLVVAMLLSVAQFMSYTDISTFKYNDALSHNSFVDINEDYQWYDENYLHINTNRTDFANRRNFEGKVFGTKKAIDGECTYPRYGVYDISFNGNDYKANMLEMPINYYVGYKVVDTETGNKLPYVPSEKHGWICVDISDYDSGNFKVQYSGTAIQKVSAVVTLIYIIVIAFSTKNKILNKQRYKL